MYDIQSNANAASYEEEDDDGPLTRSVEGMYSFPDDNSNRDSVSRHHSKLGGQYRQVIMEIVMYICKACV